ncbi:MAG TPA: hypothetical protein VLG71_01955 [Candidatus Limnocylindria bacterium]|nr:hypothetical protein [Candidatus Limnocylindria bacterium]
MKRSWGTTCILMSIGALICLVTVHVGCAYLFAVKRITFSVDPLFAPTTSSEIISFLEHTKDLDKQSITQLYTTLQSEFPAVKTLTVQRIAPDQLHVMISCQKPYMMVNETTTVTEGGYLVPTTVFAQTHTKNLPALTIANLPCATHRAPPGLMNCIGQLREQLCKQYTVIWRTELETELVDKQQPQFAVVCNTTTLAQPSLLARCQKLKEELQSQGAFEAKPKKLWIADIRFDKQIILSRRGS